MNDIGNVSSPVSNGAQGSAPAGQTINPGGQLQGLAVKPARGPNESPVSGAQSGPLNSGYRPGIPSSPPRTSPPLIPGGPNPAGNPRLARPGPVGNPRPAVAPSNVLVQGTPAFRQRVAQDLATFAPGTTVDANGFVRAARNQVPGHSQGYRLINDLLNGGRPVTINYAPNNAFAQAGPGASIPGIGSGSAVNYDPNLNARLPTLQRDGTIRDEPAASSVVLAHELIHAIHAQRGTSNGSLQNHFFTDGNRTYRETWRLEEFRTVGFPGFRAGNEATENSIRAELGFNPRAAYLDRSSWVRLR